MKISKVLACCALAAGLFLMPGQATADGYYGGGGGYWDDYHYSPWHRYHPPYSHEHERYYVSPSWHYHGRGIHHLHSGRYIEKTYPRYPYHYTSSYFYW